VCGPISSSAHLPKRKLIPPQEARRRQSRHGEAFARTALPRVQLEPPRRPDLPEGYAPSAYSDEAVVDELSSTT
jgi:hypothetical protein